MSDSPMTPEPRPLSYWLDARHPEPSDAMSEQTVLRSMAFRWASRRIQVIGSWSTTVAFAAMTVASFSGDFLASPGLWSAFAGCSALIATAYTVHHHARPVPSSRIFDRDIWISTTGRGVLAGVAYASLLSLPGVLLLLNDRTDTNVWVMVITGVSAIMILAASIMQGWHYQHARRLFRNQIEKNEQARTVLEDMSMNPPISARTSGRFGPL